MFNNCSWLLLYYYMNFVLGKFYQNDQIFIIFFCLKLTMTMLIYYLHFACFPHTNFSSIVSKAIAKTRRGGDGKALLSLVIKTYLAQFSRQKASIFLSLVFLKRLIKCLMCQNKVSSRSQPALAFIRGRPCSKFVKILTNLLSASMC